MLLNQVTVVVCQSSTYALVAWPRRKLAHPAHCEKLQQKENSGIHLAVNLVSSTPVRATVRLSNTAGRVYTGARKEGGPSSD